jgi:Asp-tRNA(Asn)/Glu-tRNA(Gln) amidotransferase A subunit family amidase
MADDELIYLPAVELARRIADRSLSPVEVMESALARIEAVQPALNAFCFVYADEALAVARAAEQAVMSGGALGPLHGVPIAIKDFTPTRGKTTTRGSYAFEHWVPDRDALIVERLRAAGAIMVGKTTTPEFAYSSFTESPLWGITRNPWDLERTPGGSSGGSGAAVAAGCVPLAEGTDMGGSVRIPAAFCGIVGLKPSLGRIPMDILPTVFDSISHFGPLARTVADAALFLSVAQGPHDCDIQSLKPALEVPVPPAGKLEGLRLALSVDLGFYAVDSEIEANTRAAAEALRNAGAQVEEVELGWTKEQSDAWTAYWGVYLAAAFEHVLPDYRDRMDPHVVALIEAGQAMGAVPFKQIETIRTEQWLELARVFETFDALLCPTMALPAPPVETRDTEFTEVDGEGRFHGLDMTALFNNVSQCPALSVPSGFTSDGLPTGLQIVGRRFEDLTVLDIGAGLEAVRPWADKRPALWGQAAV